MNINLLNIQKTGKMKYEDFVKEGVIRPLVTIEKKKYLKFHENAYHEDMALAKSIAVQYPRWAIITGYYAMHDITKLYLAKLHNIKIGERGAHLATVVTLKKMLENKDIAKRAIGLMSKAQKFFAVFEGIPRTKTISLLLTKSRNERAKANYYTDKEETITSNKGLEFIEQIVKPYMHIMERLIKDAS